MWRHFPARFAASFGFTMLALVLLGGNAGVQAQFFTRVLTAGPAVTDSISSSGVSWNDYNGDGWPDLYVSGASNQMYRNDGDGTFARITSGHFVNTPGITNVGVWVDHNNDGFLDLVMSNYGLIDSQGNPALALPPYLYRNTGPPDFELALVDLAIDSAINISASWVDFDHDGDVDLFVPRSQGDRDRFYRNEGDNRFDELTHLAFLGNRTLGAAEAWVDYDNDGDNDLYIVNRGGSNQLFKCLFDETGDPTRFDAVSGTPLTGDGSIFDIGPSWADYDNDGDFDLFLAVSGVFGAGLPDRLFRNDGNGEFTRVLDGPIVATGSNSAFGSWGDYDNDGDLDLFVAQVGLGRLVPALYRNEGSGQFTATTPLEVGDILGELPGPQGGGWGDYDNDGDLDLYVLHIGQPTSFNGVPQPNYLIRNNEGNRNHWLSLTCVGSLSNKSAIGARVRVKATIFGQKRWQTRYVATIGQSGLNSQPELRLHFGLGDATAADSVVIQWPSGITHVLQNLAAGQHHRVVEAVSTGFLRADFTADTTEVINGDTLQVQFTDRSFSVSGFPITSWAWDFDDDGTVDSRLQHPAWTFARADTYTVRLTVSNSARTANRARAAFIKVSGKLPILNMDVRPVLLGDLAASTPQVESTFLVFNQGGASDSVFVSLDPANVDPPAALAVSPAAFELAGGDSQSVVFTVMPAAVANTGTILRPKVLVDGRRSFGTRHFEKSIVFRVLSATTVNHEDTGLPRAYRLLQNYPNPFNPTTAIDFELPASSRVMLKILDLNGKVIRTLQEGLLPSGAHTRVWNGRDDLDQPIAAGVYFCQMLAVDLTGTTAAHRFSQTRKLVYVR